MCFKLFMKGIYLIRFSFKMIGTKPQQQVCNVYINMTRLSKLFFILFSIGCSITYAQCDQNLFQGEGTFYGYAGGGNCSFSHPYSKLFSAALNATQYKGAVLCGACILLTGENGSIPLSIEDQCPECKHGDIDLDEDAFPLIADKIKGRVPVSWSIISCPLSGPIEFYFKEGSSQYWTAVQIRNHVNPISTVEYFTNGQFVLLERSEDNYFKALQGMGLGPYTFRVKDFFGNVIQENNIPLILTTTIPGKNQFPECSVSAVTKDRISTPFNITSSVLNSGEISLTNNQVSPFSFEIKDVMGRLVKETTVPANSSITLQLPSPALYLIVVTSRNEITSKLFYVN